MVNASWFINFKPYFKMTLMISIDSPLFLKGKPCFFCPFFGVWVEIHRDWMVAWESFDAI